MTVTGLKCNELGLELNLVLVVKSAVSFCMSSAWSE